MASVVERIAVPFAGDGGGTDELTWGQHNVWINVERWGPLNLVGVMPMPPTTTIEELTRLLAFVTGRHQALRTRLSFDNGRPQQVVSEQGETFLDVLDVESVDPVQLADEYRRSPFSGDSELHLADPTRPSPAEVAEAVHMRYYARFDEVKEWPLRMTAIRQAGTITHLVVAYNHLIIDGEGMAELMQDLSTMDRTTGQVTAPVSGLTTLEQARLQRTPEHRRHSDAALRHWAKVLRAIPARRFRSPPAPQQPRFWELEFRSPAGYLAVRAIAARTAQGTGPVVLAAFATALSRLTEVGTAVAQVLVSNRFRPGFGTSVSPLNQPALCAIDVADARFDDVVTRAWRSTIAAGMHSYFDMTEYEKLKAEISRDRGEQIDLSCFFSDRGGRLRQDDARPVPDAASVLTAWPLTTMRWRRRKEMASERLFFHVGDSPDVLDVMLAIDTKYLSPPDMVRFVHEFEAVLVDAAVNVAAGPARSEVVAQSGHG